MKNGACLFALLFFLFGVDAFAAGATVTIQTRLIQDRDGNLFSKKAFSFLLEKQKSPAQSSCVAGILPSDQLKNVPASGVKFPQVTLLSGQKGTVLSTWRVPDIYPDSKDSSDWSHRVGVACVYLPKIHGNQADLKATIIDKQFLGTLDPAKTSPNATNLGKKLSSELNEKTHKPIAVFAVKEISARVRLRDGQTLLIDFGKSKSGLRKFLLITVFVR